MAGPILKIGVGQYSVNILGSILMSQHIHTCCQYSDLVVGHGSKPTDRKRSSAANCVSNMCVCPQR